MFLLKCYKRHFVLIVSLVVACCVLWDHLGFTEETQDDSALTGDAKQAL